MSIDSGWWEQTWAPGRDVDPPLTGVSGSGWHAVERVYARPQAIADAECGMTLCGDTVPIAAKYGAFDPDRHRDRTCHACLWLHALRTDTVAARLARLAADEREMSGGPSLAVQVAEAGSGRGGRPGASLGGAAVVRNLRARSGRSDRARVRRGRLRAPRSVPGGRGGVPDVQPADGELGGRVGGDLPPAGHDPGPVRGAARNGTHYRVGGIERSGS